MSQNVDNLVQSILEGADIKSALGGQVVQEAAGVTADEVLKAIKKLKSGFDGDDLEKALKSIKDEAAREALSDYIMEIEGEDGLVSSFLDGDVNDKEMKSAIKSFIDDVLNEGTKQPVVEGSNGQCKKLIAALQNLTAGEFSGEDLEDALKSAGIKGDTFDELYDFLAEIEEEEGSVSQLADGEMSASDFEELLSSFLED